MTMKVTHIFCAIIACAPLTFEAHAAATSDGSSSVAAANAGKATSRTASSRNANTKAGRTGDRGSNQAGAQTGSGSKGRDAAVAASPRHGPVTPQGGITQAGRSNANRLHSLLNAQARGRLARQPGRDAGSNRAVTHGPNDVRGPQGVSTASQPKLAASKSAVPQAARLSPAPRNSAIGGPRAQGVGLLGGAAISRTRHAATIDGAQPRHKF